MRYVFLVMLASAVVLGNPHPLYSQTEISLLAPGPIKVPLDTLISRFEQQTGDHVTVTYSGGLGTRKQVADGKALDVSILFSPFPEALATGNIDHNSATTIGILYLAIAVRKGASKPDISTPDAVKRTLLAAKSIACVDPNQGSAGVAAAAALKKLGIAEQVQSKLKIMKNGLMVEDAVASGDVEIAFGPYVNDMNNLGIDVVGALPAEVAEPIKVVGFVSTQVQNPKAAKALLKYFSSPEAAPVYEAAKIQPAR